jgi:hypothetical protein
MGLPSLGQAQLASDLGVGDQVKLIGLQTLLEFGQPRLDGGLGKQALEFVIDGVGNRIRHGTHGTDDTPWQDGAVPLAAPGIKAGWRGHVRGRDG